MLRAISLVFIAGCVWAQPSITAGPTAVGWSPNSIGVFWTTDVASDSKVVATCAGKISSTGAQPVHPYNIGTGWGVTAHGTSDVPISVSVANNTSPAACSITVTSCNAGGCATSSPVTSGTLAAVATTPIWFRQVGGVIKPNDQIDGRNGTVLNANCNVDGDTQFGTWSSNGNWYGICEDCFGYQRQYQANLNFIVWNTKGNRTCPSAQGVASANNGYRNPPPGGTTWSPSLMPPMSIRGALYEGSYNNGAPAGGTSICCFNILKWPNGDWSRSINPSHNTGPGAASFVGVDLTTATSNMVSDGTAKLLFPINPLCQDYGGVNGQFTCPTWQAGMDGWITFLGYPGNASFTGNALSILQCRVEDMPVNTTDWWSRCRIYAGTQVGDDGLYDSAWIPANSYLLATKLVGDGTSSDPYGNGLTGHGGKYNITPFPDASRFILATPVVSPQAAASGGIAFYDLGQWPWGKPVGPIGDIQRDLQREPYYQPGFPQFAPNSYNLNTNGTPLSGYITLFMSGESIMQGATAIDSNTAWQVPLQWTVGTKPAETLPDTSSPAPAVFYGFQGRSGSTSIADLSGNGFTMNYVQPSGFPQGYNAFDNYGWWNSGAPNTAPGSNPIYSGQDNRSLVIPFHTVQTSFTLINCFGHVPGPPVNAIKSGEIVLIDSANNLTIARHLTTATWDVTFRGTLLGAVPIANGQVGCIVLDRDGSNNVNVYSDQTVRPVAPVALFGPTSVTGSWTPQLTFGSNTNSLYGAFSTFAIYPHLTAAQLITKMDAIRANFQTRRIGMQ